jgi:acyl carrier protein
MSDPIVGRVLAIVTRVAGARRTPPAAGPETALADGGFWLDSVDLLELVVACEHEFGLRLDPEMDLSPDALRTVATVADLVRRRLPA